MARRIELSEETFRALVRLTLRAEEASFLGSTRSADDADYWRKLQLEVEQYEISARAGTLLHAAMSNELNYLIDKEA